MRIMTCALVDLDAVEWFLPWPHHGSRLKWSVELEDRTPKPNSHGPLSWHPNDARHYSFTVWWVRSLCGCPETRAHKNAKEQMVSGCAG